MGGTFGARAKAIPYRCPECNGRGNELESTILNLLHDEHGWGFAYAGQQFQVELNVGAWNGKTLVVRGKVDEIRDDGLPVDVKAFSQSSVDDHITNGPKLYYLWQQAVYTHGMGSPHYYMPIYNKSTGKMVPSSMGPKEPAYTREDIRDRVLQVEEAFHSGIMPESCPADYGCQYYYLHDQKPVGTIPEGAEVLLAARINLSRKMNSLESQVHARRGYPA